MKKLCKVLIMLVTLFISAVCNAEPFQVDTSRWFLLSENTAGENVFYVDFKTISLDEIRKTSTIWLMNVCKAKDEVVLHNIQFNYNKRTYGMKAFVIRKYSDGSIINSYYPSYVEEKVIIPDSLIEQLYELNDPNKKISDNKARECVLPESGIKIIIPETFKLPVLRNDITKYPDRYKILAEGVFKEPTVYLYTQTGNAEIELTVLLSNTKPGEIKDLRQVKKIYQADDYVESDECKALIKEIEKTAGVKVIAIDKYISKNAIFISMLCRVSNDIFTGYLKYFATKRNGKSVNIVIGGKNKELVCNDAEKIFNNIVYLD